MGTGLLLIPSRERIVAMVDWRAATIGFVVGLAISVVGLGLPVIGQIGGGLVGGFVAGYLAGGGLGRGAWHGLIAGVLGGLVLVVFVAAATTVLGFALADTVSGLLGGAGVFVVGLFLALVFALDSALAGAIGGALKS